MKKDAKIGLVRSVASDYYTDAEIESIEKCIGKLPGLLNKYTGSILWLGGAIALGLGVEKVNVLVILGAALGFLAFALEISRGERPGNTNKGATSLDPRYIVLWVIGAVLIGLGTGYLVASVGIGAVLLGFAAGVRKWDD